MARAAAGTHDTPKWMAAIDGFTFVKALGLGFLLSAVNPKNLIMAARRRCDHRLGRAGVGGDVIAIAVFTAIAASTVAIPVVGYLVAAERMRGPLDSLKRWLQDNNATVMATLILVIGAVLVGKGVSGLYAWRLRRRRRLGRGTRRACRDRWPGLPDGGGSAPDVIARR